MKKVKKRQEAVKSDPMRKLQVLLRRCAVSFSRGIKRSRFDKEKAITKITDALKHLQLDEGT